MFKRLALLACLLLCAGTGAHAQSPIIIGPSSLFAWDIVAPTPAFAVTLSYNLQVDALAPVLLTSVSCSPSVPAQVPIAQTCQVPASTLTLGSHVVSLTTSSGGITSVPSAPFAYVVMLIPVPANVRIK